MVDIVHSFGSRDEVRKASPQNLVRGATPLLASTTPDTSSIRKGVARRHDIVADRGPQSFKTMMASNNGWVCIETVPGAQCEHSSQRVYLQLTDDGPVEREAQDAN